MFAVLRRCCLILIAVLPFRLPAQLYSKADSVEVYQWLNRADDADFEGNLDKAMEYVNKAMSLGIKYHFLRGQGFAWLKMADLRLKSKGVDSLSQYYQKILEISERIKDDFLSGLAFFQQGQQLAQSANFAAAENNYVKARAFFAKTDSTFYTAVTFNELGFVNERMGNYEAAVQYNLQAISLYDKINAEKETANSSITKEVTVWLNPNKGSFSFIFLPARTHQKLPCN